MTNADIYNRDYNFFLASRGTKSRKRKTLLKYICAILVYGILIASFYFYTEYTTGKISAKIQENNKYLQSEDVQKDLQALGAIKENINFYENYSTDIKDITGKLEQSSAISSDFIKLISTTVPDNLVFENMTINNERLQIYGVSTDRQTVSEFLNSLENLDIFDEIHIASITTQENRYAFMTDCKLKGGTINEADE